MDKIYILEHGILEQYVLGELNLSEHQQVEVALLDYPELRERLEEIELGFENLAFENAIDVSSSVKEELFISISRNQTNRLPLTSKKSNRSYFAIAASIGVLLLLGSLYMYSELNSVKNDLKIVNEENMNLNNHIDELSLSLEETNKWYETINDPETEKYVLRGNDLMPDATVISYVNDSKKTVVINTKQLPELDEQHDYQMWADVDGVMINMGIIDRSKEMLAMNYINNAESLNITIEPLGGSDHPNVSQLVTNIYLK